MKWPVSRYRPIVEAVSAEHRVGIVDIVGPSRLPHIVAARKAAVLRLREAGMPRPQIARAVQRDISTIDVYLYPRRAERKRAHDAARYEAVRQARASI